MEIVSNKIDRLEKILDDYGISIDRRNGSVVKVNGVENAFSYSIFKAINFYLLRIDRINLIKTGEEAKHKAVLKSEEGLRSFIEVELSIRDGIELSAHVDSDVLGVSDSIKNVL